MVTGVMTIRSAVLLLLSTLPLAAWAQVLPDPTRPPMEIGDGTGWSAQQAAPAAAKGLLSVIISPERCAAIIDGKTIRLGEKYGDATLVEIRAQGVVLQGEHGRRSMELFPGVGVKVTAPQPLPPQAAICTLASRPMNTTKAVKKLPAQSGPKEKR